MRKFATPSCRPVRPRPIWEEMPWLMGQGVGLINDIVPAGVVVERMISEAKAVLDRLAGAQGGMM